MTRIRAFPLAACAPVLLVVLVMLVMAVMAGCGRQGEYPGRPLTMVVPWAAGGGTDAIARIVASLMERELGQPVNVVNRTGGSGVVGHQLIAGAPADGYTIGIITVEIAMMHHQGLTDLTGGSFTPLGLINLDPGAIQVAAGSPHASLGDLVQAIKANPGRLKASGTAQGGIWHVALAGLLEEQEIPPSSVVWVPSVGNAAALLDLVAGGVDIVAGSLPEGRSLIDAGRVKSLAILDENPSALYPAVPTVSRAIGSGWTMGAWRGIGAPRGLPDPIRARLEGAVKRAYESQEFRDFMNTRGFGMKWAGPEEFGAFMAASDQQMGQIMKTLGLSK